MAGTKTLNPTALLAASMPAGRRAPVIPEYVPPLTLAEAKVKRSQVFKAIKDLLRDAVLGRRFPVLEQLRVFDGAQDGLILRSDVNRALEPAGVELNEEQLDVLEYRYGNNRGKIFYNRWFEHLEVAPPAHHVDPDALFDVLPEPYNTVDNIVQDLVDRSWAYIMARTAKPSVWQAKAGLLACVPSAGWDSIGTPTCTAKTYDATKFVVGTAAGTLLVMDPLSDTPLGTIEAFPGSRGGVTVLPAVLPPAPWPLRGAPLAEYAAGVLNMDPLERGVVVVAAACIMEGPETAPKFSGRLKVFHAVGYGSGVAIKCVGHAVLPSPVARLESSTDGRYVAVTTADGAARVYLLSAKLFFPPAGTASVADPGPALNPLIHVGPVPLRPGAAPGSPQPCIPSLHFVHAKVAEFVSAPNGSNQAPASSGATVVGGGASVISAAQRRSVVSRKSAKTAKTNTSANRTVVAVAAAALPKPEMAPNAPSERVATKVFLWWTNQNRLQQYDLPTSNVLNVVIPAADAPVSLPAAEWSLSASVTCVCTDDVGGHNLFTGLADGSVIAWRADTAVAHISLEKHAAAVMAIDVHSHRWVISGDASGTVHVYDLTRSACLAEYAAAPSTPVDEAALEAPEHSVVAGAKYWGPAGIVYRIPHTQTDVPVEDAGVDSDPLKGIPYLLAARKDGIACVHGILVLGDLPLAVVAVTEHPNPANPSHSGGVSDIQFVGGVGMGSSNLVLYVYDLPSAELVGQLAASSDGSWALGARADIDPNDRSRIVWCGGGDTVLSLVLPAAGASSRTACKLAVFHAGDIVCALFPAIGNACPPGIDHAHAAKQLFQATTHEQRIDRTARLNLNDMLAAGTGLPPPVAGPSRLASFRSTGSASFMPGTRPPRRPPLMAGSSLRSIRSAASAGPDSVADGFGMATSDEADDRASSAAGTRHTSSKPSVAASGSASAAPTAGGALAVPPAAAFTLQAPIFRWGSDSSGVVADVLEHRAAGRQEREARAEARQKEISKLLQSKQTRPNMAVTSRA